MKIISIFLVLSASGCITCALAGEPRVHLRADMVPDGPVVVMTNDGTLGGYVVPQYAEGPRVAVVDGRTGVVFDGVAQLVSSFSAPRALAGSNPFTVAVWAWNPVIGEQECMIQWAKRGTERRCAQLNYGVNKNFGAVVHWAADMGFGQVPSASNWHHIAVAYEGGTGGLERVYVDGILSAEKYASLDLWPDCPIRLGNADNAYYFSGALAELRMYSRSLDSRTISAMAANSTAAPSDALVLLQADTLAAGSVTAWTNTGSAGGMFTRLSSAPVACTIDGRRAIEFDMNNWLKLDCAAPIVGRAQPWSAVLTAWNPDIAPRENVVSLCALDRLDAMQLGVGSDWGAGIFSAGPGAAIGYGASIPRTGAWHTFTYVCAGGTPATVKAYIDGIQVDGETAMGLSGDMSTMYLGAMWDSSRRSPVMQFSGAIGEVKIVAAALSPREVWNAAGRFDAFAPWPANRSVVTGVDVHASWTIGSTSAISCAVHVGTNAPVIVPASTPTFAMPRLSLGSICEWRVDELDNNGAVVCSGTVWRFAVDQGKATCPSPRTATSYTATNAVRLTWTPGSHATLQRVFFGTNASTLALAASLPASVAECAMPVALLAGTRYCWRVDSDNGAEQPTTGDDWWFRTRDVEQPDTITFFLVSDAHYVVNDACNEGNRLTMDIMNALPGTAYPQEIDGHVRTPFGVLFCGDGIEDGAATDAPEVLRHFTRDFDIAGQGRLCYPFFDCLGNHDGGVACFPYSNVIARAAARKDITQTGPGGTYSFDRGGVHFVCMNLYAGSGDDPTRGFRQYWNDPHESLDFLRNDLAASVGDSGRPVILFQHYGFDAGFSAGWGWWSELDRAKLYTVLTNYNTLAVFHGHTHGSYFQQWQGTNVVDSGGKPGRGIDIVSVGSSQHGRGEAGDCFVVNVTDKEMTVAHRAADKWGICWRKPITRKLGHTE